MQLLNLYCKLVVELGILVLILELNRPLNLLHVIIEFQLNRDFPNVQHTLHLPLKLLLRIRIHPAQSLHSLYLTQIYKLLHPQHYIILSLHLLTYVLLLRHHLRRNIYLNRVYLSGSKRVTVGDHLYLHLTWRQGHWDLTHLHHFITSFVRLRLAGHHMLFVALHVNFHWNLAHCNRPLHVYSNLADQHRREHLKRNLVDLGL
jgi:hypothetical protein